MEQADEQRPSVGMVCRHFINGSCRYGTRCHYVHEWPAEQICRYYQKGCCWYGERCRFRHITQPDGVRGRRGSVPHVHSSHVDNRQANRRGSEPVLHEAGVTSSRRYRESHTVSNLRHNMSARQSYERLLQRDTESALEACQESTRSSEIVQAPGMGVVDEQERTGESPCNGATAAATSGAQEETAAFLQSKDVTCGICMDKVYEKTRAVERRFGILPCCNHAFCLKCIVTWRKTKDLQEEVIKACPQCRVKSVFYVPHNYWVEGPDKDALITSFKDKCSKRKCSYFAQHGCCPFKSECLYWHDETQRRQSPRSHQTENLDGIDAMELLELYLLSFAFIADMDMDDDFDIDDYELLSSLQDYNF